MSNFSLPSEGYLERKEGGRYEGCVRVDSIDLSPIEGVYFEENNEHYLWLKRKPLMEYDVKTQSYLLRAREPRWEAYLIKQHSGRIAYKGDFTFLRIRYSIVGIWDDVLRDKNRLKLFIERLPMEQQDIINRINKNKKQQQ